MHTRQFIALSLSGLLIGVTTSGSAQTPPDAGALQRETQRRLQAPRPADDTVRVPSARPMNEHTQASRVTVRRLIIDGATLLPVAELQAQIADLVDQSLTFAELEHATQQAVEKLDASIYAHGILHIIR